MLSRVTFAVLVSLVSAIPTFRHPAPYNFIAKDSSTKPPISKRNVGGVRMSEGKNFTGHVWYGIYPLNECISLNDYAHNVLSFRPDEDTNCLLMQGHCDGEANYADLYYNSTQVGDLSILSWITKVESYMCMTPI